MKKLILFIGIFLGGVPFAQSQSVESPKKWEIGIRLMNIGDATDMQFDYHGFFPNIFSGAHLKRYFGNSVIRGSVGTTQRSFRPDQSGICFDCPYTGYGSLKGGIVKVGFERFQRMGKFEPYAAVDIFAGYYSYSMEGITTRPSVDFETRKIRSSVGLSPTLGVRFRFSPTISVNAETALNYGYYQFHQTRIFSSPDFENRIEATSEMRSEFILLNALSFNIGF